MSRSATPTDLAPIGAGLLSATLGLAVQASGLHGPLVTVSSWSAVGVGVVLIGLGSRRPLGLRRSAGRRSGKRRHRDRTLSHQAKRVGREVVEFKRRRDAEEPRSLSRSPFWRNLWRPRIGGPTPSGTARDHWRETVSLYRREHGADARAVIKALRANGMITEIEAAGLCDPLDPAEIEAVGLRLVELGEILEHSG